MLTDGNVDERYLIESPSNTRDDSEIEEKERAHKGGAENVGL